MIVGQAHDVVQVVNETGINLLTPVATLLAVIVGGGITYWTQRRGQNRAEDQDAKVAARIVGEDLSLAASTLKAVAEDHQWLAFHTTAVKSWPEHRGILARKLPIAEWETVSQSAFELTHWHDGMKQAIAPGGPHGRAVVLSVDSETQQRGIDTMWKNATDAYNVLAKLGGMERVNGLLHEETASSPPEGTG